MARFKGLQVNGAYYNENDPYAASWLRNLIAAGYIAPGDVDERSIVDIRADDLRGYGQCHFFAGIAGWSLATRLAGWPDARPVWTGSCPCQPFSLAGKQKGFDDTRHLWPVWRELIRERRPAKVFGEQVASATAWLGLVRSDLEAMDYAVGAIPIQAASAGADHLRDRYWFVAHNMGDGSRATSGFDAGSILGPQTQERRQGPLDGNLSDGFGVAGAGRTDLAHAAGERSFPGSHTGIHRQQEGPRSRDVEPQRRGGANMADADDEGSQGRRLLPERAGERVAGPDGVADSDLACESQGRQQRGRQFGGAGGDPQSRDGGLANTSGGRRGEPGQGQGEQPGRAEVERPSDSYMADSTGQRRHGGEGATGTNGRPSTENSGFEWVTGADGKARRVKSGIRLLAHGVPARVGKLRAFGNAIDPRPAAEFIASYMETPWHLA